MTWREAAILVATAAAVLVTLLSAAGMTWDLRWPSHGPVINLADVDCSYPRPLMVGSLLESLRRGRP
jgi:hypothetical protein